MNMQTETWESDIKRHERGMVSKIVITVWKWQTEKSSDREMGVKGIINGKHDFMGSVINIEKPYRGKSEYKMIC